MPARAAVAAPRVISASASVSAANPLLVDLRVQTDVPSDLTVTYGNLAAGTFRVERRSNGTTEQTVRIARLRADSDYGFVVYATAGGQWSDAVIGRFRSGSLPEFMQQWRFTVSGRATFGLAMSDFQAGGHTGLVALDEAGFVVWFYHLPGGNKVLGTRRLPNGDFAAIIQGVGVARITFAGSMSTLIADAPGELYTHHDLEVLPSGHVLALIDVPRRMDLTAIGRGSNELVALAAMRDVHLETGAGSIVWTAEGMVDPLVEFDQKALQPIQGSQIDPALDWLHLNSVTRGPRGNFVVSSPALDTIYSIAPDMRSVEWRLGGKRSDFALAPDDRFYYQHSAFELPNGNVLLFDNGGAPWTGHFRPAAEGGLFSRAIEYALDRQTGTARKVWEYRSTPDLSSPIISSVERLANGNTLVNFGVAPLALVEVTPDGREAWRLNYAAPSIFVPPTDLGAFTLRFQARAVDQLLDEVRLSSGGR